MNESSMLLNTIDRARKSNVSERNASRCKVDVAPGETEERKTCRRFGALRDTVYYLVTMPDSDKLTPPRKQGHARVALHAIVVTSYDALATPPHPSHACDSTHGHPLPTVTQPLIQPFEV